MSWTDERVALLKKLWGEGKTAAEIAKELGSVTRNAVIGKAHRLKLSNRVSPIQQNAKKPAPTPAKKPEKKVKVVQEKYEETLPDEKGVSMEELGAGNCRWPLGDPRDENFSFCGAGALSGLPYCARHTKLAYQAASRSRIFQDGAGETGKSSKKSA